MEKSFIKEFGYKYSFLHDLYQLCNNDIRQIDIWLEKPVMEFLNMLVYQYDYSRKIEIETK